MTAPAPTSPQEAMRFVKDYLRSIAPPDFLDKHAFEILGESPERVEQILRNLRAELADGMSACNPQPPRAQIFSMPLAFVELVRERARELEKGRGHG